MLAPEDVQTRPGPSAEPLLALASPEQKAALGTLPPDGGHRVQEARPQDCSTGGRAAGGQCKEPPKRVPTLADVSAKNIACKLVQPLQKAVWRFLRLKMELPCEAAIPLPGHLSGKTNSKMHASQCSLQHCSR